jgi:beta-glucanase (GH16 family)
MLGDNISSVGWPACGEIDIMELVGGDNTDNEVHGTAHWESNGARALSGGSNRLANGTFAHEFHVFSIVWDSTKIEWFRDDIKFKTLDIRPSDLSEFQNKFFLIFNVAVGGDWPGSPSSSTLFPQYMFVDYIRVFQK